MKLKPTYLLVFVFLAMKLSAQEKSTTITGVIVSSHKPISDVHIINLSNKYGAVSDLNGSFKIKVTVGNILLISSIQYETVKIKITKKHIALNFLKIELKPIVNILDEVFLHGLSGNLEVDIKNTPKDTIPKHNFIFNKSDIFKIKEDYSINFSKPPNAEAFTNPLYLGGVGASASIPNFQYIAEQKLKKSLARKKSFPDKIIKEFGIDFFTNDLQIPKDKIYHFISYCESRDIIKKYYDKKIMEVIKILTDESKTYHEIEH